jgi:hypothetical protein
MPDGLAVGPRGTAWDARVQYDDADQYGYARIVAVGEGAPGDTGSDFVVARFETPESIYFRTGTAGDGGALDTRFGSGGVATTDFSKTQGYSWGQDIARGVAFAPGHSGSQAQHSYNIIVAGQSSNTGVAPGIALAEYLPRNRVIVASDSGGGLLLAPGASDGGKAAPPGESLTAAMLDTEEDPLASG